MQLQAEERMLNDPDEKVRMPAIKKQLKGMTLNNDAQKKETKPKNYWYPQTDLFNPIHI